MALSKQDKIGIAILVGIFLAIGALYVFVTSGNQPDQVYSPEESPIVQRRLEILEGRDR